MVCKISSAYPKDPGSEYDTLVIVKTCTDLQGVLDATKMYFLDGIIDMCGISIEVPAGGLTLGGFTFDTSGLIDSTDDYTMFVSPVGNSGNVIGMDYKIEVTGANSKVYDITSVTGNEAFEFTRINYNNCTSLGIITGYRQGLEIGTGRFGGDPSLTLAGTWAGGYRITTSIVRGMSDTGTEPLFKAGPGFTMASRFLTDINVDLGALMALCDFSPANFPNPSTFQLSGCIITRSLVVGYTDTNILPNITNADLPSLFKDNIGISNTFVGGRLDLQAGGTTVINTIGVAETLVGTWAASELQHFDSPASGRIRHLGDNPREYRAVMDLIIEGVQNEEIVLQLSKWDDSASAFEVVSSQTRGINQLPGGRDVAFMAFVSNVILDKNDYVFLELINNTSTNNLTSEPQSQFVVEAR